VRGNGFYDASMKRAAFLSAPLLTLALVACGGDSESRSAALPLASDDVIDIRGKITEVLTPLADISPGGLVVEGEIEADTHYAKASVRLKETTVVQRRQDSGTAPAAVADLQPGTRVEVKFAGVVAQLDPVQAAAAEITIIE
jgi:hypothetical protein